MPNKITNAKAKIKITLKDKIAVKPVCAHSYVPTWMSDYGWAPMVELWCKHCGDRIIHDTMEDALANAAEMGKSNPPSQS